MGRPKGSVNKPKNIIKLNKNNFHAVVSYTGTDYVVYQSNKIDEITFILYDESKQEVIAKSTNPYDFDEIVFGKK